MLGADSAIATEGHRHRLRPARLPEAAGMSDGREREREWCAVATAMNAFTRPQRTMARPPTFACKQCPLGGETADPQSDGVAASSLGNPAERHE
jgi:hypothetical protein